ncbi:uroporphyrinogen-III synthase [Halobacillus hunanensis]|uniref:uroporphyrinogen-III synthase n=1 Tax=Halobacillus hunanensis TaxID=578214 RepID=UPI0009A8945D|nr:uroporphyrinogen-III synthase [Halobacillus hunanensis]
MNGLTGKVIGVAADRSATSLSSLIQKKGGTPAVYSIQGKQILNEQTSQDNIEDFLSKSFDWAIFTTGIGAQTLEDTSIKSELYRAFIEKLNNTRVAIRGKKTLNWCQKNGVRASIISEDGTMEHLVKTFSEEQIDRNFQRVFLQAYSHNDAKLKKELKKAGCQVYLSQPYSYEEPDTQVLDNLGKAIKTQLLHAVVFTSKTQVKNLVKNQRDNHEIIQAFNNHVLAVAVGKVTANELKENGILYVLQPDQPKMGPMVQTLERYYQKMNTHNY